METSYSTPFSKAVLTAVFAGIVTTVACLIYNLYFRERTGFSLSELINVSSLIFIVNLVFLFLGVIYYFFTQGSSRFGDILFIIVVGLLTVYTAMAAMNVHRTDNPILNLEFRHLLTALVIITGAAGSLGIPILFHNKKFEDKVI